MKTCFKLLVIIAATSTPSVLMAQKTTGSFVPFSPTAQPFTEIGKPELKLIPQTSGQNSPQSIFMNHLPATLPGENRKLIVDHSQTDPDYYYNMPVVKPGKTSKILIAKLDPNSPYTYNMPVKKSGKKE
jgi:hypothetical protein